MKIYPLLVLVISILTGLISCKCFHKVKKQEAQNNETLGKVTISEQKEGNTILIISFFSKGSGININAKTKYDKFIAEFEKRSKVKLIFEKNKWGKEGEVDYCFLLSELSTEDKTNFHNESKKILKEFELVTVEENTICKHQKNN